MTNRILTRSEVMRLVPSQNSSAELRVRRVLSHLGYRYRLHRKDIPGTPDIAFVGRRKVIFVHGCFWHGHDCKRGARVPKANRDYWVAKITRNQARDAAVQRQLEEAGWRSLTVFECEMKDKNALGGRLESFLSD